MYLSSLIADTGDISHKIKIRIGKANSSIGTVSNIWRNTKITLKTKLQLYNSIVLPTALYASETWPLTKVMSRKLDAFDSICLRKILGVRWQDHVTNMEI